MDAIRKVEGKKKRHKIKLYALSTCGWCKKTKKLLKSLDVEYNCIDFDLLEEDKKKETREELKKYNPSVSFPTIVVDDGDTVIIGFKQERIKEALGL